MAVLPVPPVLTAAHPAGMRVGGSWYPQGPPPAPIPLLPLRGPRGDTGDGELRSALALGQVELHYQPQIAVATGRLIRFEALLRWRHPHRGLLLPGLFLPAAEAGQAIHALGDWALRRAMEDAARWPDEIGVAVNVSARQLDRGGLAEAVAAMLARSGLRPARLEIELTETAALRDDSRAQTTIGALRALGTGLALDDFGTGYASLARLLDLRFDAVKIDRRFMAETRANDAVIASIVALARALGIRVVAEGVETESQLARIRAHGCGEAQGYLIGQALPPAETLALIQAMC